MNTFKQFLLEGGKATEKLGTVRATKDDILAAIAIVSRYTGLPVHELKNQVLGSTRLTLIGHQRDSGDIDIAIQERIDQKTVIEKMTSFTGHEPRIIGGNIFSFAVPTSKTRKVQVDLMFVPDIAWAKFSHHASEHSKHKSGVRNELLHSALKWSMEPGKDVRFKDEDGNDIARASRSYKLDKGVERLFKVRPMRKNNNRAKTPVLATPDQVQKALDQEGRSDKFSHEVDTIRDPNKFAQLLFGPTAAAKDLMSAEQLISMIKKYKSKDAAAIFYDAVRGIKGRKFDVPEELRDYDTVSIPHQKEAQ